MPAPDVAVAKVKVVPDNVYALEAISTALLRSAPINTEEIPSATCAAVIVVKVYIEVLAVAFIPSLIVVAPEYWAGRENWLLA